jgi:hypothetical protein
MNLEQQIENHFGLSNVICEQLSIIGDLRVVAWKLGVARSSRGKPILGIADLPGVVDTWLDWERENISDRL